MTARAVDEPHRAASPLELLFDLTFVVAIASITSQLAHGIAEGHAGEVSLPFLQVFFAIWWAWMNFTWFASSYDTDDIPYRLLTMVQMAGVLLLAAGVPAAFNDGDFLAVTLGYLLMRIGLVAQWLRAAWEHPAGRSTALRYAAGISLVQVGWLLRTTELMPADWLLASFFVLVVGELSIPRWAERRGRTSWHPHHIAERYGLFTIILLGESVLAASVGVTAALDAGGITGMLVLIATSGLVLLFALWWMYFLEPAGDGLAANRHRSFLLGIRPLRTVRRTRRSRSRTRGRGRTDRTSPRGLADHRWFCGGYPNSGLCRAALGRARAHRVTPDHPAGASPRCRGSHPPVPAGCWVNRGRARGRGDRGDLRCRRRSDDHQEREQES